MRIGTLRYFVDDKIRLLIRIFLKLKVSDKILTVPKAKSKAVVLVINRS